MAANSSNKNLSYKHIKKASDEIIQYIDQRRKVLYGLLKQDGAN